MKLITHLVIFALGAGAGIWWGVYHPVQAQNITTQEENSTSRLRAGIAQAKLELLTKLQISATTAPSAANLKQVINDEKQKVETGN